MFEILIIPRNAVGISNTVGQGTLAVLDLKP